MPPLIFAVLSHDKGLLGPLSTVLGVEDLHDLLEVIAIDAHNRRLMRRREES